MIRSLILATVLSAAVAATAWGQTTCDEIRQHLMDMVWDRANAGFDASKTKADEAYRQDFQTASATYAQALASAEAAHDGLYWALKNAEQRDRSPVSAQIADAVAERAQDRNAAHREWASSVSDIMSRWNDSMEKAEFNRSAFVGEKIPLLEKQLSDCR